MEQLKKLKLSPEENQEICKDSIVCIEVEDLDNKIPEIVKKLNSKFSCTQENWFNFFENQEKITEIQSWGRAVTLKV